MAIKTMVSRIARLAGIVMVPDWRAVRLHEERLLARLLKHFDVDCVFDVGANVGQYGMMLREYAGYRGLIVSFEPNPTAREKLRKASSRDSLWQIEPIALGATAGTARFHAFDMSELGSFRTFSESGHAPRHAGARLIDVEVRTIADFLPEALQRWSFKRPFLKMDTQGFDLEVAKGAGDTIRQFLGLQSEIAFQTIYKGAPDYRSALATYEGLGFTISGLVPIHEVHFPDLVEMDVIMVRSDLVGRRQPEATEPSGGELTK